MCGIIGVLGNLPGEEKFIKARDLLRHRGPNDKGIFYNKKDNIALGHRRLSIIDTSESGRQPFVSNDGRYVIVYNGEIYNYLELKEELKSFYNFRTSTDTEVLLASYSKWGIECFKKINGMFAFAIWDNKRKELIVVRDRLGIKPLYFYFNKNSLYFASEIKAILQFPGISRKLDKQGFLDYLSYRYPLGERTMFRDIKSLLPGNYFILKQKCPFKIFKYWDLTINCDKKDIGEEEVLKNVEDLLLKTVQSHMIGDVPIGAYLSGGLDSSLLVAMMSNISKKPVKTFCIGFREDGFNEFKYAREVSLMHNTEHNEIILDGKDYTKLIDEAIGFKDSPLSVPNEVPLHILSKELKKHISVVLSGEGADELFGGYGKIFTSGYDLERIRALKDSSYLSENDSEILKFNLNKKYDNILDCSDLDHFLRQYTYYKFSEKQKLINSDFFRDEDLCLKNKKYFKKIENKLLFNNPTEKYIYLMQKIHIVGLLHRLDSMTMSKSIEGRVPFVDHNLIEYVSSLPLKYKIAWKSNSDKQKASVLNSDQISENHDITKYILKKISSKYLPNSVVNRKKIGFPVPLNNWYSNGINNEVKNILLSDKAKSKDLYNKENLVNLLNSNQGLNIWMLFNIEIWMEKYKVLL
ncbi:MAG: asparagine synthase (glutamine-hydrolyzing) [Candidatus Falkowbacteria bacterium]